MEEVLHRLRIAIPDARCELVYKTPYQLLVSVVLSAKNTDKMVNRVMEPLYAEGFTPATVIEWGITGFLARIKSIGLAPTKAKNVYNLSLVLVDRFASEVPSRREDLESLPGVGRKTANVVLGELFHEPTLAVDTHVFRVTHRLGLHETTTADKAEKELLPLIQPSYLPLAHHLLLLHGRYVCKALSPICEGCVLHDICPSARLFSPQPKSLSKRKTTRSSINVPGS